VICHRICATSPTAAVLIAIVVLSCIETTAVPADEIKPQPQYVYKTVGKRILMLDVDVPTHWKPTDKRPAIVFFFGGGWTKGTPSQFRPQAEYFAKRGLVCCRADYRVRAKDGVLPDKCVEDAISAIRWVRGHAVQLGIDPDRIVAAGGSAGGHLAACTFFAEGINGPDDDLSISPKPNAMVLYNPALDLVALSGGAGSRFVRGMDYSALEQLSPLRHVDNRMPPTLLIDGTKDWLNPQIREFVRKCKSLDVPVATYFAEGQPHGFFNRAPWLQKTTAEADQFLCRLGYLSEEPKVPLPTRSYMPDPKSAE
jgi:acetyl esterase